MYVDKYTKCKSHLVQFVGVLKFVNFSQRIVEGGINERGAFIRYNMVKDFLSFT